MVEIIFYWLVVGDTLEGKEIMFTEEEKEQFLISERLKIVGYRLKWIYFFQDSREMEVCVMKRMSVCKLSEIEKTLVELGYTVNMFDTLKDPPFVIVECCY